MNKTTEIKLSDLKQDTRNANKGRKEGNDKLTKSVDRLKLGRGILIDKDNNIIAGNHVAAEAIKQGYTKAVVVETTGDTLVITKRIDVDLDSKLGRELAISDNVTAKEGIEWNIDVLEDLKVEFPDLEDDFMPDFDLQMYGEENKVGNGANYNDVDLSKFFEEDTEGKNKIPKLKIILEYVEEEYGIVKSALSKIAQTPEAAVFKLLEL